MGALIDTNVLVYRFDARFPDEQRKAELLLRQRIRGQTAYVPHQAIVEFGTAVTEASSGGPILSPPEARREAEELLDTIPRANSGVPLPRTRILPGRPNRA